MRELLDEFGFDSEGTPVVSGSALCALQEKNDNIGEQSILKLLDVIDDYVPTPVRDLTGPFYLPIESAFTVPGYYTTC